MRYHINNWHIWGLVDDFNIPISISCHCHNVVNIFSLYIKRGIWLNDLILFWINNIDYVVDNYHNLLFFWIISWGDCNNWCLVFSWSKIDWLCWNFIDNDLRNWINSLRNYLNFSLFCIWNNNYNLLITLFAFDFKRYRVCIVSCCFDYSNLGLVCKVVSFFWLWCDIRRGSLTWVGGIAHFDITIGLNIYCEVLNNLDWINNNRLSRYNDTPTIVVDNKWNDIICDCIRNNNNLLGISATSLAYEDCRLIVKLTDGNWINNSVIHNDCSNLSLVFDDCNFWISCGCRNNHLFCVVFCLHNPSWGLLIRARGINHNNISLICDILTVGMRNERFGILSGGNVGLNINNIASLVFDCNNIARVINDRGEWRDNFILFHICWFDINICWLFRNQHWNWLIWFLRLVNYICVNRGTIIDMNHWSIFTRDFNSGNLCLSICISNSYFFNLRGLYNSNFKILTCIINNNSYWLLRIIDVGRNNINNWLWGNRILLLDNDYILIDRNFNNNICILFGYEINLNSTRTRSCCANLCNVSIVIKGWLPSHNWLLSYCILNLGRDNFLGNDNHLLNSRLSIAVVNNICWFVCNHNRCRVSLSNFNWNYLDAINSDQLISWVIINNLNNRIPLASSVNKDCWRTICISWFVNSWLNSAGIDQNHGGVVRNSRFSIWLDFFDKILKLISFFAFRSRNLS